MDKIIIFTDGSSRGNPGPGGWGSIVIYPINSDESKVSARGGSASGGKVTELGGREDPTTNNRMELMAAKETLRFIEERKFEGDIEIHTDSAYLLQGITGWVYGWEKNGWKTKTGEPVLNQDIWKELGAVVFRLKQKREILWTKVGGHVGLLGNERADKIATSFADGNSVALFVGGLSEYEKLIGGSVFHGEEKELKEKRAKRNDKAYSYVSLVDGMVATHQTWKECEERVKGKSGVKFKKVFSKEEEDELIKSWMAK